MKNCHPCWTAPATVSTNIKERYRPYVMVKIMNNVTDNKEQLSAYMDDALESSEAGSVTGEGLAKTASHYQVIGDVMRDQLSEASMLDVSSQVSAAIAAEPVTATQQRPAASSRNTGSSWFDFSSWLQPVGGLAIAASVALVVVVTLDQSDSIAPGAGQQQIASTDQPVMTNSTVTVAARPVEHVNPANFANVNLNKYLDEHSEFAAQDTMQGRLPYVRAVGYKSAE